MLSSISANSRIKSLKWALFSNFNDDHLLSPILGTIPRLNCLTIDASDSDWNNLDSSLTSALLHLMSLPTINHIDLSNIINFPPSCFTLSVNLHRLDILWLNSLDGNDFSDGNNSPKIIVLSEMLPRIHEFRSLHSFLSTDLLHAKLQDGRPAFNFMDLRRFSMSLTFPEDERDIRYLLQNAKLLEELHLFVGPDWSLVDLHDILSPSAGFLKVLGLTVSLDSVDLELCEELEAMAGHNMLEAVSFEVEVGVDETEDDIGPIIQNVLKELVRPGWSALRQVSIKLIVTWCWNSEELSEALQFLPDKYLSDLLKLESVVFNYSVCVDQNN